MQVAPRAVSSYPRTRWNQT